MQRYGKLVLTLAEGEEQVFELAKEAISIGRDPANEIALRDGRVSRSHARLECRSDGCHLVDLGSVNGSLVNGERVTHTLLSPGDVIKVGDSILRFESDLPTSEPDFTSIDNLAELEHTFAQATVAMTITDTSRARVVVHTPQKTWEVPLVGDRFIVGRGSESDIYIDHPKVSRRHAQIERQGTAFVINDLGSTNRVWMGGQAIEKHKLQSGDTVQIGPARLVFKDAFQLDDLTHVEQPLTMPGPARIPVVFVPGLMGSELWLGNERVWPNVRTLFSAPELYILPEKAPLEPRGILNEVVIVPNLIKQEQYNRLGDYLVESLGYKRGVDLMEFAYDWRQDVRQSARKLAQAIDDWQVTPPIILIAHSLGSLVSRYYLERLDGKKKVERVIFLGGPHYGVPKAIANLMMKVDLLPFGLMGDRLRQILVTLPSLYQILPIYQSAFDQNGQSIDVFEDESWLPEDKRPLLRAAREFRREVGQRVSVKAVSIFGYGLKTVKQINVERTPSGEWTKVEPMVVECGDSTIPDASTVLAGSEIHPVEQYHGSLYVDNDVKMRLKLELTGHRRPR